jgi:hypothetical protein
MPPLPIPGRLAKLRLSKSGEAGSWIPAGGIVDVNLDSSTDEMDVTTHDDNGNRRFIPNHSESTMDCNMRWIGKDLGQRMLREAEATHSVLFFQFDMEPGVDLERYEGELFVTKASRSGPLDDSGMLNCSFRLSGVERTTQPDPATGN